jgi:Tfp pilus assembly PilM family ATPase
VLAGYADERLASGAFADGEIVDRSAVAAAVAAAAAKARIYAANVSLPESKSYLFETAVPGSSKSEWRTAVEQRLDEFVPLPPPETVFDIVKTGQGEGGMTLVAGIGFAHRIVDDMLSVFDEARIKVQVLEGETFASSRALLHNDQALYCGAGHPTLCDDHWYRRARTYALGTETLWCD